MSREIYAIRWRRDLKLWVCPQLNWAGKLMSLPTKAAFIQFLASKLKRRWVYAHIPSQLRVFGKSGRIQFERTYGRDPQRYPS